MGLSCIPFVETCCFCLRNLKTASILIAVFTFLSNLPDLAVKFKPWCYDIYAGKETVHKTLEMLGWFYFISELFVLFASAIFLLGIYNNKSKTANVFMCAVLLVVVVRVMYYIVAVSRMINKSFKCGIVERVVDHDTSINIFGKFNFSVGKGQTRAKVTIFNVSLVYQVLLAHAIISGVIWIYFIVVVNTYSFEMGSEGYDED